MNIATSELVIAFLLLDMMCVGFLAVCLVRRKKSRIRELRAAADELGLRFSPGDDRLLEELAGLPLVTQAIRAQVRNVLADVSDAIDARIFDCQITVAGHERLPFVQTAIYLQSAELDLPWFAWRTNEAAELLRDPPQSTEVKNLHGFEWTGHRLLARKPQIVGELFQSELLGRLESFPQLCIEADGDRLLLYRLRRQAKPADLRDLLTRGIELLGLLRQAVNEQRCGAGFEG